MINLESIGIGTGKSLEVVPENSDSFAHYKERFVRVFQQGYIITGKYLGMTKSGYLMLGPFVEEWGLTEEEQKRFRVPFFAILNKGRATINSSNVQSVYELNEKYVMEQVTKFAPRTEDAESEDYVI